MVVRFHEKWIRINGESYDISDLKNALEELLPTDGSQRQVEHTVYSTVSKDREEEIFTELQNRVMSITNNKLYNEAFVDHLDI